MGEDSDSRDSAPSSGLKGWEGIYADGRQLNRYPFESVVAFVFTNAPERPRSDVHILEVGCGAGNNLWFAAREGFQVTGFDGSPTAIAHARARFAAERLEGDLRVMKFGAFPFADGSFDLAIDRQGLTCTDRPLAEVCLAEIRRTLRPGGRLLSVLRSARDPAYLKTAQGEEPFDPGRDPREKGVCFYDRTQVSAFFAHGWKTRSVSHIEERDDSTGDVFAEWRIIAERT